MKINREVTRTILNATETTKKTRSLQGSSQAFVLLTSDKFYVGFSGKFATRYLKMATVNTNASTLSVKQWTGSAYEAVEDLVDETEGFTQSGWVHWQNKTTWKKSTQAPITEKELYWTEWTVSADLSAGTAIEAILNLFSDDNDLRVYYPELITDTRHLPDSRSDFLEQHEAAKDLVVLRLRERKAIESEAQIIDVNRVNVAAIHACAKIIYGGMGSSERILLKKTEAEEDFESEISQVNFAVDKNKDGVISDFEKKDIHQGPMIVRR